MTQENKDGLFLEYMKMIQNVIDRQAKNSFKIKAWTATIYVATVVLTYSIINILIFIVLIFTVALFWALDSYYLKQERLFRALYKVNVKNFNDKNLRNEIKFFDMDIKVYKNQVDSVLKTMISLSELLYYSAIILTLVVFLTTYLTLYWQILTS